MTTAIARPNGVALSPDEKILYVANTTGDAVIAFDVDGNGDLKNQRDFAKLALPPAQGDRPATSGSDGIAVDASGRLFVATTLGVQVLSAKGEPLGVIALSKQPQNLAFGGGPKRNVLYVVGRGTVYRIATQTRGTGPGSQVAKACCSWRHLPARERAASGHDQVAVAKAHAGSGAFWDSLNPSRARAA